MVQSCIPGYSVLTILHGVFRLHFYLGSSFLRYLSKKWSELAWNHSPVLKHSIIHRSFGFRTYFCLNR